MFKTKITFSCSHFHILCEIIFLTLFYVLLSRYLSFKVMCTNFASHQVVFPHASFVEARVSTLQLTLHPNLPLDDEQHMCTHASCLKIRFPKAPHNCASNLICLICSRCVCPTVAIYYTHSSLYILAVLFIEPFYHTFHILSVNMSPAAFVSCYLYPVRNIKKLCKSF